MPIPITRSVQFPDEPTSTTRPVALDGPVLTAGATAHVLRDRRWLKCVIARVEYSTVYVTRVDAA